MRVWGVVLTFLVGLAVGIGSRLLDPDLFDPYLPEAVREKADVEGSVATKKREGDRLLLTVVTAQGAILATFKEKMAEVDLLVAEGDRLTLALRGYKPFVEDPVIARVRKRHEAAGTEPPASGEKGSKERAL